jgi:hypothetical protein
VDESRKRALLIAASILAARNWLSTMADKRVPGAGYDLRNSGRHSMG